MVTCQACIKAWSCNTCRTGRGCWHNWCPTCARLSPAGRAAVATQAAAARSAGLAAAWRRRSR